MPDVLPDVVPLTKEYVDNTMTEVGTGSKRYVQDRLGNFWEVGRFDVPTQTYWCTRVEKNFVLLDSAGDENDE